MSNTYFLFQSQPTVGQPYPGNYITSVLPNYELRAVPFRAKSVMFFDLEAGLFSLLIDVDGLLIELPISLRPSKSSTHVLQIGESWHYLWANHGDLYLTEITENIPLASVFE